MGNCFTKSKDYVSVDKSMEQQVIDLFVNADDAGTKQFRQRMTNAILQYVEERANYIVSYENLCVLLGIKPKETIHEFNLLYLKVNITGRLCRHFEVNFIQECVAKIQGFVTESLTINDLRIITQNLKKQVQEKNDPHPPPYAV